MGMGVRDVRRQFGSWARRSTPGRAFCIYWLIMGIIELDSFAGAALSKYYLPLQQSVGFPLTSRHVACAPVALDWSALFCIRVSSWSVGRKTSLCCVDMPDHQSKHLQCERRDLCL